jgi:hypothetical protein
LAVEHDEEAAVRLQLGVLQENDASADGMHSACSHKRQLKQQ